MNYPILAPDGARHPRRRLSGREFIALGALLGAASVVTPLFGSPLPRGTKERHRHARRLAGRLQALRHEPARCHAEVASRMGRSVGRLG